MDTKAERTEEEIPRLMIAPAAEEDQAAGVCEERRKMDRVTHNAQQAQSEAKRRKAKRKVRSIN